MSDFFQQIVTSLLATSHIQLNISPGEIGEVYQEGERPWEGFNEHEVEKILQSTLPEACFVYFNQRSCLVACRQQDEYSFQLKIEELKARLERCGVENIFVRGVTNLKSFGPEEAEYIIQESLAQKARDNEFIQNYPTADRQENISEYDSEHCLTLEEFYEKAKAEGMVNFPLSQALTYSLLNELFEQKRRQFLG